MPDKVVPHLGVTIERLLDKVEIVASSSLTITVTGLFTIYYTGIPHDNFKIKHKSSDGTKHDVVYDNYAIVSVTVLGIGGDLIIENTNSSYACTVVVIRLY